MDQINPFQPGDGNSDESDDSLEYSVWEKPPRDLGQLWEGLIRIGLAGIFLRISTAAITFIFILVIVWGMGDFFLGSSNTLIGGNGVPGSPLISQNTPGEVGDVAMPQYAAKIMAVSRKALLHTIVPNRPRTEVGQYTVIPGDSVYGISQLFNLQPQTIFWGNYEILADDVHRLSPGQVLNILPADGVYYEWRAGNSLNQVAEFFGVTAEAILSFPANHLNPANIGDFDDTVIDPGTWLVIPGGKREFVTWSAPLISREDPTVARVLGAGFCSGPMEGPVGSGSFIWPTSGTRLSGFDYSPPTNHYAIDIGPEEGQSIFAADAGVVVYAGWNDWGYGNVIVIDHGNGWQSLYAHLNGMDVGCGSYVYQGDIIGLMGNTGIAPGTQLHFELRSEVYGRPDPREYLP